MSDTTRGYGRVVGAILLFCVSVLAGAQCNLASDPVTLSISGFGTAHFQDFETNPSGSLAELSGSVCIVGENGVWTITAERATISGLRSGEQVQARIEDATLLFDGWRVVAENLESDGEELELSNVTFTGRGVMGSAGLLAVDTVDGRPTASDVRVLGENFRLHARQAELTGSMVDLDLVEVTTCTCPGEPFYTVSGGSAQLDLEGQRLEVIDGQLQVAGVRMHLGERVELSSDELQDLSPPVTLEYRPNGGTGLGVVVPELELEEGLSLEMGLLGLDPFNPLLAFALVHYREENVSFTVGRARGGPRADFEVSEAVTPVLEASFAVRNRHEEASDYLHEGVLRLQATPEPLELGPGQTLEWHARAFSAASSQTLAGGPVVSPRLGVASGVRVQTSVGAGGNLAVAVEGQATGYPAVGASQYGIRVHPTWSYRLAPWTVTLGWDRLWTNSGSPFSTKLDRLTPKSQVSATVAVAGPLGGGADGRARFDFGYDLRDIGDGPPSGLDELGAGFGLSYPVGLWAVAVETRLELAGLIDPDPAGDRDAYLRAGVSARQGEWEAGTRLRYDLRPEERGLGLLEASAAVPLTFDNSTITPFLALDFVPLLENSELPRISGHGINVTWASCCGTVRLGYRQQEGVFSTEFGLALEH